MNRYITQGIVLSRTDFGEADRIVTFLTPNRGKITTMARGARKSKSKLAGAIELFSISDLTILPGRGEIQTLMSARLAAHYEHIVKDLERTQSSYEMLKIINKATEDQPEAAYFTLLNQALESINNSKISAATTALWFKSQLLRLTGHMPNLRQDQSDHKLPESANYDFDVESMHFQVSEQGAYTTNDIKFLRLLFGNSSPNAVQRVQNVDQLTLNVGPLIARLAAVYFRMI